jgi:hypothetical protein
VYTDECVSCAKDVVWNPYTSNWTKISLQKEDTNSKHPPKSGPRVTMATSTNKDITESTQISGLYDTRLELCICLNNNETINDISTHIRTQLQEIIQQLLEVDNSIQFIPWFDNDKTGPMEKNLAPDTLQHMNRYFPRLHQPQAGFTYGEFRILHKRKWEHIILDISQWLSDNKHGIYFQTLQCSRTTNLGWLLWSFRQIDTLRLQQELKKYVV